MENDFQEILNTAEARAILADLGSNDYNKAINAQRFVAKAMETPLRQGVFSGNILDGIFSPKDFTDGRPIEFPLDIFAPGSERDHVAYVIPKQGYIPSKNVEGGYVTVPTYRIGSSIGTFLQFVEYANWDIIGRMSEILEAGFVKKMNDDGYHTLLAAGVDRNINVYDSDAPAGTFTKRLISLMKSIMRRNGGGNSTSMNRRNLTDVYGSVEMVEDIRNWNVDQVDPFTRRDIMVSADGNGLTRIYDVNLHVFDELGVGQEYQLFFANDLAGTMGASDEEIIIGLDRGPTSAFLMPVRKPVEIFEDVSVHRSQRVEWYGWSSLGFCCLENRNIIIGSF